MRVRLHGELIQPADIWIEVDETVDLDQWLDLGFLMLEEDIQFTVDKVGDGPLSFIPHRIEEVRDELSIHHREEGKTDISNK